MRSAKLHALAHKIFHWEAMKRQEEIDEQLAAKKREVDPKETRGDEHEDTSGRIRDC